VPPSLPPISSELPPWHRGDETPEQRVDRVRLRLRNLRDPGRRTMAIKILDGQPFAEPGTRDEDLNRMCATLAYLEPALEVEEMVDILRSSLVAMAACNTTPANPAPTEADARQKCSRQLEQARNAKILEHATHERIRRGLLREARDSPQAADPGAPDIDEEERGFYTEAELADFAASQDCDGENFQRRWIIQRGTSYYVFVAGTYQRPIVLQELETSLERDLAPVPEEVLTWWTVGPKGEPRRKRLGEFLREYATVARDSLADLTLRRSFYDPDTQIFHEAACPMRNLEPRFDERIDQWLRFFGDDEVDKLLDWIATISRLEMQTCALYLSGPPATGKTLLVHGLSKLWSPQGKPTELARVIEAFNSDLTSCPLIFADEHIAQSYKGQRASAELRQLIGSNARTLARKFIPNASLNGAIRLVLAANNEDMLAFDEDLTGDDLEAVSKRFLHVKTPLKAAEYLKQLGGRNGECSQWVDGDLIARHALWLAQNRQVVPGDRFLVEGRMGPLHQSMPTKGKIPGLVCEWLVQLLDAPEEKRKAVEQTGLVLIGNGEYLVNVKSLTSTWSQFITSDGPPTTGKLGRVLKNLSLGTKRVDDARFHSIRLDLVFQWADSNQVGRPDHMRGLVARVITDNLMAPVRRMSIRAVG